jgi:hypothetical protein
MVNQPKNSSTAPEKQKAYIWHRGLMREAKIASLMLSAKNYDVVMCDLNNKQCTKEQLLAQAPEAAALPYIIIADKNFKGDFKTLKAHESFAHKPAAVKPTDKTKRTTVAIVKPKS